VDMDAGVGHGFVRGSPLLIQEGLPITIV